MEAWAASNPVALSSHSTHAFCMAPLLLWDCLDVMIAAGRRESGLDVLRFCEDVFLDVEEVRARIGGFEFRCYGK